MYGFISVCLNNFSLLPLFQILFYHWTINSKANKASALRRTHSQFRRTTGRRDRPCRFDIFVAYYFQRSNVICAWFYLYTLLIFVSFSFKFISLCKDHCILIACCPSWSVGDETPDIRKHSDANGVYLLEVSFLSFLCEDAEYNYQDTCENLKSMIFLVAYYDWHAQAWYFIWFCQDRRGELMHASISWQLGSSRSQYSICDATCGN